MKNTRKINNDLYYIGSSSRQMALFENIYPIPNGASYNSYLLKDDKTVLFDTIEKTCSIDFFDNLKGILEDTQLDYLVLNHVEPDHGAMIKEVVEKYPKIKIVCTLKTKQIIYQFFDFDFDIEQSFNIVKEGDILDTGHHKLTFIMAPMVHWPEVMVTYDTTDKTLFSADAFGSFGAISGNLFDNETNFDSLIDEYRRYYTNIVGKYGPQVTALLNKAKNLEIKTICPLHGLILKENISKLVEKYTKWASYEPETKSALIVYGSIYGNTKNAAEILASKLGEAGVKNIKLYDISKTHVSYILSDSFNYSHIVIATITYNNGIFSPVEYYLSDLVKHNLQNRKFALIENGSWAPNAAEAVKGYIEKLKNCEILKEKITLKSTLKETEYKQLKELSETIAKDIKS